MLSIIFKPILLILYCTTFSSAFAAKLPGNIALHIAKTHYQHPVRILHPYLDFWHMKGPLAEKAALTALQKRFTNVNECTSGTEASVVLLLEPHVFYNPQLRVFHAEFIARAYTDDTASITRIKKQARQNGDLAITPNVHLEQGYTKAIEKVIAKLTLDKAFLATLDKQSIDNSEALCHKLDDLPIDKIYY